MFCSLRARLVAIGYTSLSHNVLSRSEVLATSAVSLASLLSEITGLRGGYKNEPTGSWTLLGTRERKRCWHGDVATTG
jgi:hypothetical protein